MSESADGDREVIDRDTIEALVELGGDDGKALLKELVDLFLADSPPRLQAIEAAYVAGDARTLERTAHALKSRCTNLGAKHLADLCKKLEDAGRGGAVAAAKELIDCSKSEFALVERALGDVCK